MQKFELGQTVFYFTVVSDGPILAKDEVRGIFESKEEILYSLVSNPYNMAWYKKEDELFASQEIAFEFVKRPNKFLKAE